MPSLPQLLEEDVREIDAALSDFLQKSEATAALIAAEGGFVIFQQGDTDQFDATSLGALAANAFSATQAIAGLLNETSFATVFQQGVNHSILIGQVNRQHTLIVVFPSTTSVGAVKYFAAFAIQAVAAQLNKAKERAPDQGFDLATLNITDSADLFRMKGAPLS
jgi:predicted regulator of Ras-like GTPase activity (Roadblock/LC7/MglB family)